MPRPTGTTSGTVPTNHNQPGHPSRQQIRSVRARLLAWFRKNGRSFPWRHTRDPYKVLIAEKLLQQTAAQHVVVAAYWRMLGSYPTPTALAHASRRDLARIVQPLGLHYRAAELRRLGEALCSRHGGRVPSDLLQLKDLPGVGEYIARAVRSFAFNIDCGLVDANIARFLSRLLLLPGTPPSNPARSRSLLLLADAFAPRGNARQFNLGLIDLAAAVCTPRDPRCPSCPVSPTCGFAGATRQRLAHAGKVKGGCISISSRRSRSRAARCCRQPKPDQAAG